MPVAARQDVAATTAWRAWPAQLALGGILVLAVVLRTLWLSQNGWGRTYYAAGVRSMLGSWHNFFFNAFDPGGFVSLDKPPIALWLQVASAKLFGFNGLAMLLPQVVEGVIAIVLVYVLVRRAFGELAGLLAALFLALTPISVAVDRSNNTDSCLVMVLLLALWALVRALETGRGGWLLASMACIGLAFNVKMAAALVLVPAMVATYLLLGRPQPLLRRIVWLGFGGVVLAAVSLAWAVVYDLVPAASRPYAGSTNRNSMLELALVHNGLARFTHRAESQSPSAVADGDQVATAGRPELAARRALWDDSPVGALRLLRPHQAAQVSWLLPLALAGLLLGLWQHRQGWLSRPQAEALALWGGWLLSYWIVLSYAGGVVHTYYLMALAPPVSALAGIGLGQLWTQSRSTLLPVALAITGTWAAFISVGSIEWQVLHWSTWLFVGMVVDLAIASLALLWAPHIPQALTIERGALAVALVALLAMPCAWALSVVLVRPNVATPSADLAVLVHPAASTSDLAAAAGRAERRRHRLIAFLLAHHANERFILATPNALQAAPIVMATGKLVMATGGYLGRDPILTPAALQELTARGDVRFILTGGPSLVPADDRQQAIDHWVRSNGAVVDRSLWLPERMTSGVPAGPTRIAQERAELYDMRPRPAPN
jgi:4-amino-4-deoxy-L-arabinose transferase-like glycosyltransferase